jgi:ankyrin repeat protein
MLRVLSDLPSDVGEELTIELQKSKFKLLNELGEGGWGVIHYAVFCNRPEILEELIKRRVNVNKCTTDGWLPLQLAINRKNL